MTTRQCWRENRPTAARLHRRHTNSWCRSSASNRSASLSPPSKCNRLVTASVRLAASYRKHIESAERRLRLWNVTDEQITKIEQTRQAEESLPILSKVDGVVQTLPVTQGANVAMGSSLVEVADLSVVWVWGEFYQDELPMLQIGQEVTGTSSSYPVEKFRGQITLIDPFIDNVKRTGRERLDIQNPDLKLKPDMYVDLVLDMDMGKSLVVPVSAIIPTGKRNIAFVDKSEGKLEPRVLR